MGFSVEMSKTIAEVQQDVRVYSDKIGKALTAALFKAGSLVKNTAQRSFKERGAQSVSGEPPRNQTFRYRNSITVSREIDENGNPAVYVGTNVRGDNGENYPLQLEFGTSKQWPHPVLTPALKENQAVINGLLKEALGNAASD